MTFLIESVSKMDSTLRALSKILADIKFVNPGYWFLFLTASIMVW